MENKLITLRKTVIDPEFVQKSAEASYLQVKKVMERLFRHWQSSPKDKQHREFNAYGNRSKTIK